MVSHLCLDHIARFEVLLEPMCDHSVVANDPDGPVHVRCAIDRGVHLVRFVPQIYDDGIAIVAKVLAGIHPRIDDALTVRHMTQLSAETLLNIGFRDIAKWMAGADGANIRYVLDGTNAAAHDAMLDVRNALYAFVSRRQG